MTSDWFIITGLVPYFLRLSTRRKQILLYLFWYHRRFYKAFPSIKEIATKCGLQERAVQTFFAEIRANKNLEHLVCPIKVTKRFNGIGGDSSNLYELHPLMIKALQWLRKNKKLSAKKRDALNISLSMEAPIYISPSKTRILHPPLILNTDSKNIHTKSPLPPYPTPPSNPLVWLNPKLFGIGIDLHAQKFASKYASDFEIADTIEAFNYQLKNRKVVNKSALFNGILKNKMKPRIGQWSKHTYFLKGTQNSILKKLDSSFGSNAFTRENYSQPMTSRTSQAHLPLNFDVLSGGSSARVTSS